MGNEVALSNNEIILDWKDQYSDKINASKVALGIHHNRKNKPLKSKVTTRQTGGEITKISVSMKKGDIMTHKGKGKYPDNRIEKPWFNPITTDEVGKLADDIANATGDVIAGHILIR